MIIDPAAYQRYAYEAHDRYRVVPPGYARSVYSGPSSDAEDEHLDDELRWDGYESIDPKRQKSLTEHDYFLIPRRIDGFALKQKSWSELIF